MVFFLILLVIVRIVGWGTVAACFCLWLGWIPIGTSLLKILICQICLLPAYVIAFLFLQRATCSSRAWLDTIVAFCILLYLPWVYVHILHSKLWEALGCSFLCILLPAIMAGVFFPQPDIYVTRRQVTKARLYMRSLGEALNCYHICQSGLPFPEDQNGDPVTGFPHVPDDPNFLLYFVGPSFFPMHLVKVSGPEKIPEDPFAKKKHGSYSYGMGTSGLGDSIYILSSPGPDKLDESEELEGLFLYVHEGNKDAFEKDPLVWQLQYSPTNGTASSGGLYQAGVLREGEVWW